MRRVAATAVFLAFLGASAPAHAQTPPLAAELTTCETGAEADERFAVFSGSMPREGAAVMAMRFQLQQRLPGGAWERLSVEGWGDWIRAAKRGVPGFIYTKRLERLTAPGRFRAVVTFRWSDRDGSVLRSAKRFTDDCRQPDWRADLRVRRVTLDEQAGTARVVVRNAGRGVAEAFAVHAARGDLIRGRTLAGLPAGERATLTLRVGRCAPGESVTVTLDPEDAVAEAAEDNNVLVVACPA